VRANKRTRRRACFPHPGRTTGLTASAKSVTYAIHSWLCSPVAVPFRGVPSCTVHAVAVQGSAHSQRAERVIATANATSDMTDCAASEEESAALPPLPVLFVLLFPPGLPPGGVGAAVGLPKGGAEQDLL